MRRSVRKCRVALLENKRQIARGLSDETFQFLEANMSRDVRKFRVAVLENKRQIARGLSDETFLLKKYAL